MVRSRTAQTLALALLVAPLFAGNNKNFTYLALGDSIAFGFDPTLMPPTNPPLPRPEQFIGYPERVAAFENLLQSKKEVNAACPGETSGSFLVFGAPDNHCQGFKNSVGLHTAYPGSQLEFATSELASNKHIDLVTLSIGGNDLLLLQQHCANPDPRVFAGCVQTDLANAATGTLATYAAHLAAILKSIRANYQGTLILMTSYSPSSDSLFTGAIEALNKVMVGVGSNFGVKFADSFTAFQIASMPFSADPCQAGLLIRLSPPLTSPLVCDVHPSPYGRDVLAATVLMAIGNNKPVNNNQPGKDSQNQ